MQGVILLTISLLGAGGSAEYARPLGAKNLDQATLDSEGYGEKKALKREDDGLRITLSPGDQETGWKTPQQVRLGGDFTISAEIVIKKLPKPAMEDGAAVGLAIAMGDINQPDVTLVRLLETNGSDVYRPVEKQGGGPMPMQVPMRAQMRMQMMGMGGMQPGGKPPKPPRHTFPAAGDVVRMQLQREGTTIRLLVLDKKSTKARYLGQVELGPMDVAAVKLFATNRNGAEAVNVLLRELTIRADRISGLGTVVRTVFDEVIYNEPTALDNAMLTLGGPPRVPAANLPDLPDDVFGNSKPSPNPAPNAAVAVAAPASTPSASPASTAPAPPAQAAIEVAAPIAAVTVPAGPMMAGPVVTTRVVAGRAATRRVVAGQVGAGAPPQQPGPPKPKVRMPLDEIESIRYERTAIMSARFVAQSQLDFTMPGRGAAKDDEKKDDPKKEEAKTANAASNKGETKKDQTKPSEAKQPAAPRKDETKKTDGTDDVLAPPPGTAAPTKIAKLEPKPNGIRDLYLSLSGLRPVKIQQISVNCQTDKGPAAWRLDTTDSEDAPLVIRRSGTEATADLFIEPPAGDCHQKDFTIMVNYEDGQAANTNAKAGEHTSSTLAVDPKMPGVAWPDAWIYLATDEKLFGKLEGIEKETLRLLTPWQDHLSVPLTRVVGFHVGLIDRKETPEAFAKRLKTRGTEDLLLAQTKKGEVIAVPGILESTERDRLLFHYQNRSRTIPLQQVEGVVLAARPESRQDEESLPIYSLLGGAVISGRWMDLDSSTWKIEMAWGQTLNLPAPEIEAVRLRGGKMSYLSDLKPDKVEETPFFGHRLPWRRDLNLTGEPLRMNGLAYDHGLAVHSRCILTYDLGGRYSTFETLVGFDDAVKGKGRVDCRVVSDGKELYANPDLRADAPPVKLKLVVAGAEQLRLIVDFGRGQDTGDRVIWANARLYRQLAAKTANR
jgi:hypothetical protein